MFPGINNNRNSRADLSGISPCRNSVPSAQVAGGEAEDIDLPTFDPFSNEQPRQRRVTRSMSVGAATSTPRVLPLFECTACGRTFQTNRGLRQHERRAHPDPILEGELEQPDAPVAEQVEELPPIDILPDDVFECSRRESPSREILHPTLEPEYSSSPVVFLCPECGRSFKTKTGLGVHRKRAHPLEYEAEVQVEKSKPRWSQEEKRLLALREAELRHAGKDRINELLLKIFKNRTLESIKGQRRRNLDHKFLVSKFMDEIEESEGSVAHLEAELVSPPIVSSDDLARFQDLIQPLLVKESVIYKESVLNQIWNDIGKYPDQIIKDKLTLYCREVFPDKVISRRKGPQRDSVNLSRRQKRQAEYKRVQLLYKKARTRCITSILSPTSTVDEMNSKDVFQYWTTLMGSTFESTTPHWDPIGEVRNAVWEPISISEISAIRLKANSAPGPDGLTVEDLRIIPSSILCKLFNLFLVLGEVPRSLLRGRTIFIPKCMEARDPSDLRPISITSVLLRLFHKILAKRVMQVVSFDFRQRGFMPVDGCALNTLTLSTLIKNQRSRFRDLFLASIDLRKAFDLVSHKAIIAAASAFGLPSAMLSYLRFVYQEGTSSLVFKDDCSSYFHPTRGVRQGDPLSPILFNMVMDQFLRRIPRQIGVDVGATRFSALAFADDLLLMSTHTAGLQSLLDLLQIFLCEASLETNVKKSFGLAIRGLGKEKKVKVDSSCHFSLGSYRLPMKSVVDTWTYLGIEFSPEGRCKVSRTELDSWLRKLRSAPLKPQQRLYALKTHVIPKLLHVLTLGRVYMGFLNQLDRLIRQEVRRWLRLPHDLPVAYFHSKVSDGGLGITSLRWQIPNLKVERLTKIKEEFEQFCPDFVEAELRHLRAMLRCDGIQITSSEKMYSMWRSRLYRHFDGIPLKESSKVPDQHNWIREATNLLDSRDFVNCVKLRCNALPTRSRTSRGRQHDRSCRAGCSAVETLLHVLQVCHRTHEARIRRHDSLVDYLANRLTRKEFVVVKEPRLQSTTGVRKPDIVAVKGLHAFVIDAQVVSDTNLQAAHERKKNKYKHNESLVRALKQRFNTSNITFHTLTLNYCGVWSPHSVDDLINNQLINKSDIKMLSVRTLVGGMSIFNRFSTMTSVRH